MEKDTNPLVMVISNPETEGLIKQWNDAVKLASLWLRAAQPQRQRPHRKPRGP